MDSGIIQKRNRISWTLKQSLLFSLLVALVLPSFAFASGAPYPISIYEPYRIKRNTAYIFIENPADYYSYLLGDKLDTLSFYMAYRYFQGKPLSSGQISDLEKIFKNNGNYISGNDPSYWDSDKAFEAWKQERSMVMKDNFAYGQESNSDDYNSYQDNVILDGAICPSGTFENATKVLQSKKKTLNNTELQTWVKNQDRIFLNCFERWSQWRDRTWGNSAPQITCDNNKLQDLKPPVVKKEKKGFFSWLKSLFGGNKEAPIVQTTVLPSQSAYYLPFTSSGSSELKQDEEMQNALYYYYKAKKEFLCSNISGELFKKISEDLSNPYHVNATLGYIRNTVRDSANDPIKITELLRKINEYLGRKDLSDIKDSLLVEKEKILSSHYDEAEFIQSQKGLENPQSSNFIHNAAIFYQQYQLFVKNHQDSLANNTDLSRHSELVRFLYYWNFGKPDSQYFSGVESEYAKSGIKNLWLALLLKNSDFGSKYIDTGLNINRDSKLYYPILYYAYRDLMVKEKGRAMSLAKSSLSQTMPDIAYNYFADLIMQNVTSLDEAIQFMDRKSVYLKFLDSIDYGYVRSKGKTLESMLNQAGWQDEKTGATYYYKLKNKSIEAPVDDGLLSFINFGLSIDRLYSNPTIRQRYKEQIFARAFILNRKDIYTQLLPELSNSDAILAQARDTVNDKTQKFLIAYAILRGMNNGAEDKYGLSIHNENYNYGDYSVGSNLDDWSGYCNYCSDDYSYDADKDKTSQELFDANQKTKTYNKFLTSKEVSVGRQENEKLFTDSLVQAFAEPVLSYMESNPRDGRIPEVLSLIIKRARRWHYRDSDGDWTKKVFQTLQYKYPKSKWAQDTPVYW